MKYITFFIKFFYRIRYWLIFVPIIVALLVFWKTRHTPSLYTSSCSIYTGVITGVNILSESGVTVSQYSQVSLMDNLLNILTSDQTLKQVSLRLYARIMVHGDLEKDNNYIMASHFRPIYDHGTPIHHLIDHSSSNDSINEQRTYENLFAYESNSNDNYVYGIYQWHLPYVNKDALRNIYVERVGNSDVIDINYTTDDPGITYQTLLILTEEFIKHYQHLRFGEIDNVINYFRRELSRIEAVLKKSENALTDYRITNRVINYDEETKAVAALNRDYELQYWESQNVYTVSDSLLRELEKRMQLNTKIIQNNNLFIHYNNLISEINEKLAMSQYYPEASLPTATIDSLNRELKKNQEYLTESLQKMGYMKYTKEGISNANIIEEWLAQVIANKKAEAELKVLKARHKEMIEKYVHFAPIGSNVSRKEREVSINEKQYLNILDALNAAILRQKSLQMTSSTLKPMNDPYYPLRPTNESNKKLTIAAYLGTLLFTIFFFLIVEILDHRLSNIFKVQQLTGRQVLGIFIRTNASKQKEYNDLYRETSAQTLCNYATTYFVPKQTNIINFISNEPGEGKSYILEQLAKQFTTQGMEVRQLSWHEEFQEDAKTFVQALQTDLQNNVPKQNTLTDKVILVEYPSLKMAALTPDILQGANLNLQIVDSRRTWKNTDQQLLDRSSKMSGETPLFIVLNDAQQDTAEDINGLMPPYTFFRKLFYRLSQLGLTTKDQ